MSQRHEGRHWLWRALLVVAAAIVVLGVVWWVCEHYLQWSRSEALTLASVSATIAGIPLAAWLPSGVGRAEQDFAAVPTSQQTRGSSSPVVSSGPGSTTVIHYGNLHLASPDGMSPRVSQLGVTDTVLGEISNIMPLTHAELSWLLWGKPGDHSSDSGPQRRETAQRLADAQPHVHRHLEQAVQLVPYCDSRSEQWVGPDARRVGFLSATIAFDVKIRNTGSESAGIRLTQSSEPTAIPGYTPADPDHTLIYAITPTHTTRREVAPGAPVAIRSEAQFRIWFNGAAELDPIGYLRLACDLAGVLAAPINFVSLTGLLDDGREVTSTVTVVIPGQEAKFAIQPPDLDALHRHLQAIDSAIQPIPALHLLRSDSLKLLTTTLHELRARPPTEIDWRQLRTAAEDLVEVAARLDHAVGGPQDSAAAKSAASQLRRAAVDGDQTNLPTAIEAVLSAF